MTTHNITPLDTPCREWAGYRNPDGYGSRHEKQPGRKGKMVKVHRWVMAQIHGWEALEGKVVMHLCDNPPCYRYDHLRIGTHSDNMRDRHAKGRSNNIKTHCKFGHEFTAENTRYQGPDRKDRYCGACLKIRNNRRTYQSRLGR